MPKVLEKKLMKQARKLGLRKGSSRYGAYVYGTLYKIKRRR